MSPVMAAAAAITGRLTDVRKHSDNATPLKSSPKLDVAAVVDDIDSEEDMDRVMDIPADSEQHATKEVPKGASGGLPKFEVLRGIAAPLEKSNVDTDAIIPKQFLKTIKRTGLGTALFHPLRYNQDTNEEDPSFILNKEPYRNSKILVVTGPNFGCGSSREHAPWALLDFGIKCIIAPSYADIFFNNTFKNGMLPIAIDDKSAITKLADEAKAGRELEVDLPNQVIRSADGQELAHFDVEEFRKHCLVQGLDDIGLTMQKDEQIKSYEDRRDIDMPWISGAGYLAKWRKPGHTGPVKVEAAPVPKTNRGQVKDDPIEW